jgi:hypothetical protein
MFGLFFIIKKNKPNAGTTNRIEGASSRRQGYFIVLRASSISLSLKTVIRGSLFSFL